MSAIDETFRTLRAARRKAFLPFVTAGDPDLDFTRDVIRVLADRGANLCEIGIPYSDPIADGPVIQASYTRALAKKIKLSNILATLKQTGQQVPLPLVTMVSYAIVYRHGLEQYVSDAEAAGVAGAIIPDLPLEEAVPMADICRRHDFSLIQLVTPTTSRERALRIAETTSGFLYYVSVTGITGERSRLPTQLIEEVTWLREQIELPICIGFGISRPEQARQLAPVADGIIVGSAIVRCVAKVEEKGRGAVLKEIGEYAAQMVASLTAPK